MRLKTAFWVLSAFIFMACNESNKEEEERLETNPLSVGVWQGQIEQNDSTSLKFNFSIEGLSDSSYVFKVKNAEEEINATMWQIAPDSFKIEMPVFANYFLVKQTGDQLKGFYINPDADDYKLAFSASANRSERYPNEDDLSQLGGYWKVVFEKDTDDEYAGLAYFDGKAEEGLYATIMTATGDYRYLEGSAANGILQFSAFDGAHLFSFKASVGDTLRGSFHSGRSYHANWIAYRDSTFRLPDPDTLTYINEGYTGIDFAFPNLEGDTIQLQDEQFEGKAVIVQISGTWCPNCYDESRYMADIYQQYQDQGLEIVCLSFERTRDYATAQKRLAKMKRDLNIPYTVLLAGATREDKAAEKLPMLNHIMSYPTAIYLDKNHMVRKIHTGFAGPGTPVWEDFVSENDAFLQKLLNE